MRKPTDFLSYTRVIRIEQALGREADFRSMVDKKDMEMSMAHDPKIKRPVSTFAFSVAQAMSNDSLDPSSASFNTIVSYGIRIKSNGSGLGAILDSRPLAVIARDNLKRIRTEQKALRQKINELSIIAREYKTFLKNGPKRKYTRRCKKK